MRIQGLSILLFLIFGAIGCAMLQEAPLVEIPASLLTCDQTPEMVDGDLKTVGTFVAQGSIKKEFVKKSMVRALGSTNVKWTVVSKRRR